MNMTDKRAVEVLDLKPTCPSRHPVHGERCTLAPGHLGRHEAFRRENSDSSAKTLIIWTAP